MALDGVKQTEHRYQNNNTTAATGGAEKTSAPNSVYDVDAEYNNGNNTETSNTNSTNATELDKQLQKLCERLKKYNITVEDIKKNNLLYNISNLNEEQLQKLPEEKLEKIMAALEQAIKDAYSDNKIDWKKAGDLGKDYLIALATGWTIDGFKKHNQNVKKSSLLERLIETGCLPKDANINNMSMDELKKAVTKFNQILLGNIKRKPTEKEKLAQLQTFGRLLINSPEEEKELFLEVIKSLYADNRAKGLDAVMTSCDKKETRESIAQKAGDPEYIREVTTAPIRDAEGNIINDETMSQEDATQIGKIIAENQSEEARANAHKEYDEARNAWYEKNKEILEKIDQKIQEAKAKGIEPEFTEEEIQVLLEQQNFIIGVSSGEFIGTLENTNISDEFKKEHLDILNRDSYKLPSYKDILEQIKDFAEKCPDSIKISAEELTKNLDKATNGNYTKVSSGAEASELNPPQEVKTETTEIPDYGFAQKEESVDTTRLTYLQQQIQNTIVEDNKFRVEKNISQPNEQKTANTLNAKLAAANTNQDKLTVIKEFFDRSPLLKMALEKYLASVTDSLSILNALPTNARKYLAQKLIRKGLLNADDIQKLNLSYNEKQLLQKTLEETEKQNAAV